MYTSSLLARIQRRNMIIKLSVCAALFLVTIATIIFVLFFTISNGLIVKRSVEQLDLNRCETILTEELLPLESLREIDIREHQLTVEDYEALQQQLPDCRILWSVPMGSEQLDCSAAEITLPADIKASELDKLKYFEDISKVDATACTVFEALHALAASDPDFELEWGVVLGGEFYPSDSTSITLGDTVAPKEWINLTYLDNLSSVEVSDAAVCPETASVCKAMPDCRMQWNVDICGQTVSSDTTELDLSSTVLSGFSEWQEKLSGLSCLPNIQRVDLCGSGLTSAEMDILIEEHPGIKFIWEIYISAQVGNEMREWTVRTDALAFSTLIAEYSEMNESHFQEIFKYCTDLVALDIGHNKITDISGIENLTKLKYLILHDNRITDLSPLAACTELEYIELNWNNVSDLTPLCGLQNLQYLYMMGNEFDLDELKELAQLQSLKHVAITKFDVKSRQELAEICPGCDWNASYEQWYGTPTFHGIKKIFDSWQYVTYMETWKDVEYDWSLYQ